MFSRDKVLTMITEAVWEVDTVDKDKVCETGCWVSEARNYGGNGMPAGRIQITFAESFNAKDELTPHGVWFWPDGSTKSIFCSRVYK